MLRECKGMPGGRMEVSPWCQGKQGNAKVMYRYV